MPARVSPCEDQPGAKSHRSQSRLRGKHDGFGSGLTRGSARWFGGGGRRTAQRFEHGGLLCRQFRRGRGATAAGDDDQRARAR